MHTHTKESLIAFEDRIRAHWESGAVATQVHLCGGNEEQLLKIFADIRPGDWVFSTHRNHYHALLCGMPEAELEQAILDGRSMFSFRRAKDILHEANEAQPTKSLQCADTPISSFPSLPSVQNDRSLMLDGCHLVSTAILAGQCGIAAGVAWAMQWHHHPAGHLAPKVWCFLGDGAEEEGHFYEAALWVESHNLPCTFIIEDNGYQMDTPKAERRAGAAWNPLDKFNCVRRYTYTRTYPHAGTGTPIKPLTASAIERARAFFGAYTRALAE